MYKRFYKSFLEEHTGKIHLNAHSHHFWPDCTKEATITAWEDSARLSDDKWNHAFTEVIPKAQKHIARILNLSNPEQLAFAPNSHELLARLFSSFIGKKKVTILTTSSEFHSLGRQVKRLLELDSFEAIILNNEEEGFQGKFLNEVPNVDIVFISHVFFNSGKVLSFDFIEKITELKGDDTIFCLDGYHGFCAIPTDLSSIEDSVYYIAGGYKYAQAGEGACFMSVPKTCQLRPVNTGWFASFETLESTSDKVEYSNNGMKFWGATQDLTPWYRFNAVWDQFSKENISIENIHKYIASLQAHFINKIVNKDNLLYPPTDQIGHFITFKFPSVEECSLVHKKLQERGILTDYRGSRLRFGFGMYLSSEDIDKAIVIVNQIL
jgi:selenocysteine lyase/cysteine desulfurase